MSNVFDMFQTTTELTECISNLQLTYNGLMSAFMGIGIIQIGFAEGYYDVIAVIISIERHPLCRLLHVIVGNTLPRAMQQ